nr:MAG: hypothetical protein [Bacteriophage sp.]
MRKLIANTQILYMDKVYGIGDELPTSDPVMLQAWLDAESAEWHAEKQKKKVVIPSKPEPPAPETIITGAKVQPMTAEPGMPGESMTGDPEELIGKIPKTGRRK